MNNEAWDKQPTAKLSDLLGEPVPAEQVERPVAVFTMTLPLTTWITITSALEPIANGSHVSDRLRAQRALDVIEQEMNRRGMRTDDDD